jgi:hypothetical protein
MGKVSVTVEDEAGKQTSFETKTLTKLFSKNRNKTFKVSIQEPGFSGQDIGTFKTGGGPINKSPVVELGENKTVRPKDLVVMDASISDPENGILEVTFIQEGGFPVQLERDPNDQSIAQFLAPEEETTITFGIIVKDDAGNTATDKIVINVEAPREPCAEHFHRDPITKECVPDTEEPPTPEGDLLYDSNRDIDWGAIKGEFLKVTDKYGNVSANGKGFHMNASGNPRAYLYPATKEIVIEHDGQYGRAYFAVCNYACRIEGEFKLDTAGSNASFKSRNRHQFRDMVNPKASDEETQGGQGTSFSETKVDADCEIVHGTEISGPSATLNPKAKIGQYHSFKFSQFDDKGKIHIIDELDGKVVNDGFTSPPKQFFNKGLFESWSEFWVRLNADKGGRLYIKNLKVYKL